MDDEEGYDYCPECRVHLENSDHKCLDSIRERVIETKNKLRYSDELELLVGQRNFYKILLRDMEAIIKGKIKRYPFERSLHFMLKCKKISYEKIPLVLRHNVIIYFINLIFHNRKIREEGNFKEFIDNVMRRLRRSAREFGCFQHCFRFD